MHLAILYGRRKGSWFKKESRVKTTGKEFKVSWASVEEEVTTPGLGGVEVWSSRSRVQEQKCLS